MFAKKMMLNFLLVLFAALALIEAKPTRRHVSYFLGFISLLAISLGVQSVHFLETNRPA